MRERLWAGLAVLLPAALYAAAVVGGYDGQDYLRGDCPYYFHTAVSLWRDGDLDLANQLPGALSRHFDSVSLDRRGRVVPKHPILLPLLSAPLIALLGRAGALVFNLAQLLLLVLLLYRLARRAASPPAAAAAVALTGSLTLLPHYAWNYSPDILASLLLVAGAVVLTGPAAASGPRAWLRPAAGGALLGLACMAKLTLACFLLGAAALLWRRWRDLPRFLAGLSVPLLAMAALNVRLFGAPQVTSYDRIVRMDAAGPVTYSQRDDFRQPLRRGLRRQLWHPTQGLLATSAVSLVSLLGLPLLARRRPRLALFTAAGSGLLFVLLARYQLWEASHYGNRFLMPAIVLAALPLASLLELPVRRLGADGARAGPPPSA